MAKDTVLSVILRLKDEMGGQAKKALDALAQAAKGAGASAKSLDVLTQATRTTAQGAGAAALAVGRIGQNAAQAAAPVRAVSQAVSAFRSERVKQAAQEMARVRAEATQAKRAVDETAKSSERLAQAMTRAGGAGRAAFGAMRAVGQAGAGAAAGAGVAAAALKQPMDFDKRLALMANTAFSDRDVAGRIAGKETLRKAVKAATDKGGGGRDDAAAALDSMLSSGVLKQDEAMGLLPIIQKHSTGSGGQSTEIADIVIRGVQNKMFTVQQAGEALDKALAAGQAGGFELKDMSKWLGKMFAFSSGMKGMAGYEQILAYAQAAVTTAGSKDDAGNNLVNLLQKLNSQDTQKDFAKLGVDLTGTLVKAREKGKLPLEAFIELLEKRVISKDKRYADLKKKLEKATGDDRKQILNDMADIAAASAMGQVIKDRQALLAGIAGINQKEYMREVKEKIANSEGAGDMAYATVQDSTAAHAEQAKNEFQEAMSRTLDTLAGPLNAMLGGVTGLAQNFPLLTTAAVAATTAITAMTAAAAAFGAMRLFTGGGGAAALTAGAGGLMRGSGGVLATAGLAAYDIYATESNGALTRNQKNIAHAENAGGLAAALAMAKAGAALGGTMGAGFGGIGAVPGAVIGGLAGGALGWWSGSMAGRQMGNWMFGPSQETAEAAKKLVVEDRGTINVETTLNLDGREVARVVNEYNAAEARRH